MKGIICYSTICQEISEKRKRIAAESSSPGIELSHFCQQMATGTCEVELVHGLTVKSQGQRATETCAPCQLFCKGLSTSKHIVGKKKRHVEQWRVYKGYRDPTNLQMAGGLTPAVPRIKLAVVVRRKMPTAFETKNFKQVTITWLSPQVTSIPRNSIVSLKIKGY